MSDKISFSVSKKFLAGILTVGALQSLQQDYWGLEGTVRHVVDGWISWKFTVPAAIGMLVLAVVLCVEKEKGDGH